MEYKELKDKLKEIKEKDHEKFVKAILALELDIKDEKVLNKLYEKFVSNDKMMLINEEFQHLL